MPPGGVTGKVFLVDGAIRESSPLVPGQVVEFADSEESYAHALLEALPYVLEVTHEPATRHLYDYTLDPGRDPELARRARERIQSSEETLAEALRFRAPPPPQMSEEMYDEVS